MRFRPYLLNYGAFPALPRGRRNKESLVAMAIFIVFLSIIVLGAHYLTGVVKVAFL